MMKTTIQQPKLERMLFKASLQTFLFIKLFFWRKGVTIAAFVLGTYAEELKKMPGFSEKTYKMLTDGVVVTKK